MSTEQGVPLVGDAGARRNKLLAGGVLLALGVVGAVLTPRYGFMAGLGAAIFGISGLSVLLAGLGFSGRGPCPSCGAEVRDVPRDAEAIRCSGCGQYCLARAAHLFPTPPDHVATHEVYAVTVEPGTQPDFHGRCAACGQPATRTLPRELSATVVGAPGVARRGSRASCGSGPSTWRCATPTRRPTRWATRRASPATRRSSRWRPTPRGAR